MGPPVPALPAWNVPGLWLSHLSLALALPLRPPACRCSMPAASLDDLDWIENGQVFRHERWEWAVGGKRSREALSREPRRDAISHDIQQLAVHEHVMEHSRVASAY